MSIQPQRPSLAQCVLMSFSSSLLSLNIKGAQAVVPINTVPMTRVECLKTVKVGT